MVKTYLILLFVVIYELAFSQVPGNIFDPHSYSKCNATTRYKAFYKSPLKLDTLIKPQSLIAKRVWRFIDFKEIETKRLFTPNKSCEYLDFFEILKFGIVTGKINAFTTDKFGENALKYKIEIKKCLSLLTFKDTVTETIFDSDGNSKISKNIVEREINSNDLAGYMFCEDWFFDSHWSQLDKRMVFICPILKNEKTQTEHPLFYLYYNECRELFSSFKAINMRTLEPFTYDQFILSHLYPSFVVKTSNVFNRTISEFKKGADVEDEHNNSLRYLHNSESDLFGH